MGRVQVSCNHDGREDLSNTHSSSVSAPRSTAYQFMTRLNGNVQNKLLLDTSYNCVFVIITLSQINKNINQYISLPQHYQAIKMYLKDCIKNSVGPAGKSKFKQW